MHAGIRGAILAALLLLSAAPTALAQSGAGGSTPTTLYFHIFDTFNKFPINTQPMDVEFFDVGGTNFPTVASQGYDFNTIYGYSSAGPVEYDFIENGRPRYHPERGIAGDVRIDDSVQPTAYVYIDVRDVFGANGAPMALPALTVRVSVREGDDLGDEAKLDSGKLIMHGRVTAHIADASVCVQGTCSSAANGVVPGAADLDGNPVLTPDEEGIVEFAIPLALEQNFIPRTEAFNVRIDWWQDPAGSVGEDQFSTGYLRLVADARHLPRLELAVRNPIWFDFVHPQVAGGLLLIHTGVISPWGTFDIDVANMTLEIAGPSTPGTLEKVVAQHAHVHGMHDSAAEITYLWRFREENAANGQYTIALRVPNLQGTAVAESTAGFRIEGKRAFGVDESGAVIEPVEENSVRESPGALVGALAALAAAAVVLRGRGRR